MRKLLMASAAAAIMLAAAGNAQADMAAAEKFLAEEINGMSVLSADEQKAEMEFEFQICLYYHPL